MQMDISQIPLRDALIVVAICAAAAIAAAVALLFMAAQQVRDLEIPPDADFFEVMQVIPITIPIALDLLDGALDVFSAPISWVILEMMGLGQLKMITLVESLIPGTQLIPTLTISWIIGRYFAETQHSVCGVFLTAYRRYGLNFPGVSGISPLWTAPNIIITPHTAGFRTGHFDAVVELFAGKHLAPGLPVFHRTAAQVLAAGMHFKVTQFTTVQRAGLAAD